MIHDRASEFHLDLRRIAESYSIDADRIARAVTFDLQRSLVLRTPKDTGRAASSWGVSKGKPRKRRHPKKKKKFPNPAESAKRISDDIKKPELKGKKYTDYWIWNNVPYIQVLEYGLYKGDGPKTVGGFSKQAPHGMVRISLAETEANLEVILRRALAVPVLRRK